MELLSLVIIIAGCTAMLALGNWTQKKATARIITQEDVDTLRDILESWDAITWVDEKHPEDGYRFMTDHLHHTYDQGRYLLKKLEAIALDNWPQSPKP